MSTPVADFSGVELKLIRADHHRAQLVKHWNGFLEKDFARLVVEDNPDGTNKIIKLVADPLPSEIILTIGDAIHSMRSALDHAIHAIFGGDSKVAFPFSGERQELESAFCTDGTGVCPQCQRGGRRGRYAPIEARFPGMASLFLDEIRPYKGGNDLLWAVNKLDVTDKHRLIIPTITINKIAGIYAKGERSELRDGTAAVSAGGVLHAFGMPHDAKIEKYDKPTAEILFSEGGIVEGQPLLETLVLMSENVSESLERLKTFLVKAGWKITTNSIARL